MIFIIVRKFKNENTDNRRELSALWGRIRQSYDEIRLEMLENRQLTDKKTIGFLAISRTMNS